MTVSYKVQQQAMFMVSPKSSRSNKASPASPIVSRNRSTGRVSWADLPSDIIVHVDGVGFALHKAHPTLSDIERKQICKLMDCQKLSPVACSHAAQNERLPVYVMVQVLYFEQLRLRSALSGTFAEGESLHPVCEPHQLRRGTVSATMSPRENCATLKKENDDLRLEVTRMRMRLSDLESHHPCDKASMEKTPSNKKFFSSVSKTFNKINPFGRSNTKDGNQVAHGTKSTRRRRRHSLS